MSINKSFNLQYFTSYSNHFFFSFVVKRNWPNDTNNLDNLPADDHDASKYYRSLID